MSASFPRSYIRWPHLPSCLILIAFDCMTSGSLTAQTTNPAYIHDFPSVDRVKAEIKGANPTDTLARQVAVFTYLPQIVQRMKAPRGYRSPLTPDEQRVIGAYDLAAYQLSQDFAKTHTPEEAKAFAQLHGRYEMDSKFYDDWYKRLVTPNVSRQYDAANATEAAHYKAHVDQQIRENDAIRAQQQQAQAQANRGFVRNDPGTVAVRRCIELGCNELSCVGKGLMTGLMGTDGMSDSDKAFFGMEDKAGLLLNGLFKSSGSKLALRFGSDVKTEIDSCGQLEPATFPYTLSKRPNALQVTVNIEPRPITLTMTREGNLIGPRLVDVKGQIIIGHHEVWMQKYIDGVASPGGYWTTVNDYAPKTERCSIASLAAQQPRARVPGRRSRGRLIRPGCGLKSRVKTRARSLPKWGIRTA